MGSELPWAPVHDTQSLPGIPLPHTYCWSLCSSTSVYLQEGTGERGQGEGTVMRVQRIASVLEPKEASRTGMQTHRRIRGTREGHVQDLH